MGQVYEDNSSRWEQQPDGSFTHLPKQKQPPTSLGSVKESIAANAAAVSQNTTDITAGQIGPGLTAAGVTAETGWSLNWVESWAAGSLCQVTMNLKRLGADIVSGSTGNIADQVVAVINDSDYYPADTTVFTNFQSGYVSGGAALDGTTGEIKIRDANTNGTIATAHDIQFTFTYRRAGGVASALLAQPVQFDLSPDGLLELPSARVYHNAAKTIVGTSTDAPLSSPLTLDFTNPYSFPLRVRTSYQPHWYGDAASTTYMRIYMDGLSAEQYPDSFGNAARKQYNGQSGIWYDGLHMEATFTVPPKTTVTFEVRGRNTADQPTVNYGTFSAQALGVAGNGTLGQAIWAKVDRTSSQTITRATGDQHIDFTSGVAVGGMTWDSDGIVVPSDGVYVAMVAVNAPWNQTGGGTNGHFTLTANGFYGAWCNTNTTANFHRATFQTPAHPTTLTAGSRVHVSINPMSADGNQTTIESANLYVFRVGDSTVPPRHEQGTATFAAGAISSLGVGSSASQAVTFARPFTTAPHVTVGARSLPGGAQWVNLIPYNVTTTGFTLYAYNMHTSALTISSTWYVRWEATEPG